MRMFFKRPALAIAIDLVDIVISLIQLARFI